MGTLAFLGQSNTKTNRKFNLEKRKRGLWKPHFEWLVQTWMRGLKSNLGLWAERLSTCLQSMEISENLMEINSAAQLRKLGLFSV